MSCELPADITRILNDLDSKDRCAVADLLPVVYADLRRLVDSFFRKERRDHTLQPTALVHEAYVRLMNGDGRNYESREHFYRTAAVVMRHILIHHARDRAAQKRGGDFERVRLADDLAAEVPEELDLVALDGAITRLAGLDARQAEIVCLRFFAGLTVEETAATLKVSKRTVEQDWTMAKAWLWRELKN